MHTKVFICYLTLLSLNKGSLAIRQCPPAETIAPCVCNGSTQQISCRGGTANLAEVFSEFVKFLPKNDQTFHSLYLNSRDITRLEANAFKGVKFRAIFLGGSKLTYIHKDAFRGTEQSVKELYAFATNLSLSNDQNYDLFAAISSLQNLQKLVISGSNIHKIPDRAFRPSSKTHIQKNLTEIEFGLGFTPTIKEIGFAPFADLPSLHSISFSGQQINSIKFHAFSFHEHSNKTLTIDLTGNNLNSTSFQVGAFLGAKRPVKIHFGLTGCNNSMTFLNQTIFEAFLEENRLNSIDIGRKCRNIICDCRMDWILYGEHEDRVKHLKCRDGKSIKESRDRYNSDYNISTCLDTEEALSNKLDEELDKILTDLFKPNEEEEEEQDYNAISLDKEITEPSDNICTTKDCVDTSNEMSKYLNTSVDPCDDFYTYACGNWEDSHLIQLLTYILSHGGVEYDNFVRLRQQVDTNLDLILSQDIVSEDPISVQYAMSMYQTCKDNEDPAYDALADILKRIGGWPIVDGRISENYDWMKSLAYIFTNFRSDIIISLESFINVESVRQLKIDHSSFLLSTHKLLDVNSLSSLRDVSSYVKYIHNVAVLLGAPESNIASNNDTIETALEIVKFESEIAKISDKSDGKEFFIERNLDSLKCVIPEVDWFALFANILNDSGVDMNEFGKTKVVYDIHYMIRVSQLLKKTNPKVIANYLGWRVVETFGFLTGGPQFLENQLVFHNIQSNEKTKSLWKQCLYSLQNYLPMALTRKYAENFLPPKDKQNVTEIVKHVKQSFINLIEQKDWVDVNRRNFTKRVDNIVENVAYPDWIFDDNQFNKFHNNFTKTFSSGQPITKSYIKLWKYWNKHLLLTIGDKVDKSYYWDQSPLYVGASYDIMDNIITLPLGILHPPFYYTDRPAYLNYGTVGAIIGHEISHGSMPRYNIDETLMHPWNQTSLKSFLTKAKCFVDQYSGYFDDLADLNLEGIKTFEEDMSDVAGLKSSFLAFESYAKQKQQNGIKLLPSLSMYSYKQLFFLAHAQKWCRYITAGQVRTKILKGVHSPEKYRVNGAVANFDEFSNAFNCPIGSKMNPEVKCELW